MSIIRRAMNVILPQKCTVCSSLAVPREEVITKLPDGMALCFDCMSDLAPMPEDKRWMLCLSEPYSGDPIPSLTLYMPFKYNGFFSRAVPAMKFQGKSQVAEFMGMLLGNMLKEDKVVADLIVSVPLSEERLKERGYNQAEIIAQAASEVVGIPAAHDVLERVKDTERQTSVDDKAGRGSNVDRAFRVREGWDITDVRILLIDDVATTGHTLHSVAETLYAAGARNVLCCAVCGNRYSTNDEVF